MFSVYIRTHSERLHLALQLNSNVENIFKIQPKILNTGVASEFYSENFVSLLKDTIQSERNAYILILEDDMLFSHTAISEIENAISQSMPYVWFSIPHKAILDNAVRLFGNFCHSYIKNNLYYSGSVLIQTEILKTYVESYAMLSSMYEIKNVDVTLSRFLINEFGHNMFFCASQFATDPKLKSSISNRFKQRHRIEAQHECDPLFDINHAMFRYREDTAHEKTLKCE